MIEEGFFKGLFLNNGRHRWLLTAERPKLRIQEPMSKFRAPKKRDVMIVMVAIWFLNWTSLLIYIFDIDTMVNYACFCTGC